MIRTYFYVFVNFLLYVCYSGVSSMKKSEVIFKNIPDSPGVYFFKGPRGEVLYVGKATSLRDRVKSYFAKDIAEIRSPLIEKIVSDSISIDTESTDSVLEALILEAKLIKKYSPPGNTDQKDNKSWNYLVITKEQYPRVLVARERELTTNFSKDSVLELFGPFPSSTSLKEALKIIRKIFPFFDTPFSLSESVSSAQEKTIRFNQSIGLFPKEFNEREYKKTIRAIRDIFSAKKDVLLRRLEKEMNVHAKALRFEEAERIKRQIFALQHIQDITLIKDELRTPETAEFRIEAYDVAHTRGGAARGVMTVVVDGEADPKLYRSFIVRTAKRGDDYGALDEILRRRSGHPEWGRPKLIVIDGGKGHLQRAKMVLSEVGMSVEVVSVVKDEKHRPKQILGKSSVVFTHEASILKANAEAHRFAIGRHRRALRKGER